MQQSAQVMILSSTHKPCTSDATYFLLVKISLEAEREILASSVPRKAEVSLFSVTNYWFQYKTWRKVICLSGWVWKFDTPMFIYVAHHIQPQLLTQKFGASKKQSLLYLPWPSSLIWKRAWAGDERFENATIFKQKAMATLMLTLKEIHYFQFQMKTTSYFSSTI